jgi:hypothetical protein
MEQASNTSRCSEGEQLRQLARMVKTGFFEVQKWLSAGLVFVRTDVTREEAIHEHYVNVGGDAL